MRLSYSNFQVLSKCVKQYHFRQIKEKPAAPIDEWWSTLGTVFQTIMEVFYNEQKWTLGADLRPWLREALKIELDTYLKTPNRYTGNLPTIQWGSHKDPNTGAPATQQTLLDEILTQVDPTVDMIKENVMIYPTMECEVSMFTFIQNHRLTGRPDFVFTDTKKESVWIWDGKGSKNIGRYVSDDQLLWYAYLHWSMRGIIPDRLDFAYWRHGVLTPVAPILRPDTKEPYTTKERIYDLQHRILKAIVSYETAQAAGEFIGTPSNDVCRVCDYRNQCSEYSQLKQDAQFRKVDDTTKAVLTSDTSYIGWAV